MNGFSEDGYIIDQDYFGEYSYRTIPSSRNGCGWMAAYDLRKFLGQHVEFDAVRREMDEMHELRVPGPTTMNVMRNYLMKYVPGIKEVLGRSESLELAKNSLCGILRYNEENIPHFVCYISSHGRFRFFNVNDGLEDFEEDMDAFFEKHCLKFRFTALFAVEKQ